MMISILQRGGEANDAMANSLHAWPSPVTVATLVFGPERSVLPTVSCWSKFAHASISQKPACSCYTDWTPPFSLLKRLGGFAECHNIIDKLWSIIRTPSTALSPDPTMQLRREFRGCSFLSSCLLS